jgi:alkylresorcinol/alkylpyrone synthase
MGLRPDVRRVPLVGLGCAGGVTGLATAAALARASPGAAVLLVAVETCSLALRWDRPGKADLVAAALFADGAAAAVLRCAEGEGPSIGGAAERKLPDSLDVMGWEVDPIGLGVIFDRGIPDLVLAELPAILAQSGLDRDVDRYVCHPGGAKVLAALERVLDLRAGALDHERAVLAGHGNMSGPTVLFVLERALAVGVRGRLLLSALGPGFTASLAEVLAP